jgi:hypothetical protein
MLKRIVFEDEITLWWTKDEFNRAKNYKLYLNGEFHGEKDKTHYTFANLQAETKYAVRIEGYLGEQCVARELEIVTSFKKNKIYITDEKYGAVGDGVTMNTRKIQKALDGKPVK